MVVIKNEDKKEIKEGGKKSKECFAAWNSFVEGLIQAEKGWELYCKLRLEAKLVLEDYPLEIQKILYLANPRGQFDLIVEDMITQARVELYLPTKLIKEGEKKS